MKKPKRKPVTLDDIVKANHALGLRVMIQLVPNEKPNPGYIESPRTYREGVIYKINGKPV